MIHNNAESPKIIAAVGELYQFKKKKSLHHFPDRGRPPAPQGSGNTTLPGQTARDIILGIHGYGERSGIIDDILQRLDTLRRCFGLITTRRQQQP